MNMHATGQTIAASRPVTMPRLRTITYWAVSAPVLLETAVGAEWDLARIPYVREIFAHLGYPLYLHHPGNRQGARRDRARRAARPAREGMGVCRRVLRLRWSRVLALRHRRWLRQDRAASCLRGFDVGVVRPLGRIAA
jgi:hypothetical protein